MVETAEKVREILSEKDISCSVINARFVKPVDEEMILSEADRVKILVTMEENVQSGGFGEKVLDVLNKNNRNSDNIINVFIPDKYVEHGNPDILKKEIGIDADSVAERINRMISKLEK